MTTTTTRSGRGIGELAVCVLVVVAPMFMLLWPAHRLKVNDWLNTLWAAGYTKTYFEVHGSFPQVFNTDRLVGQPAPVFYGPLLYPALSVPTAVLGAEWGLRATIVGLWVGQFVLVRRLFFVASGSRVVGIAVAAAIAWAVYPLTNVYNRAAIAEVVATVLLVCSACAGALALIEPSGGHRPRTRRASLVLLCGWCGTAAAAAHPITAMLGGFTLACLAPAALLLRPQPPDDHVSLRPRVAVAAALAAGATLVMAPWLYAVSRFLGSFAVHNPKLEYFPPIDSWYARFAPVPFDNTSVMYLGVPGRPYIDAQLSLALLALLVGAAVAVARRRPPASAWRRHAPLLAVSLAVFLTTLLVSVVPSIGRALLPKAVAGTIQFAYRLVTYHNLAMLAALLALLSLAHSASPPGEPRPRRDRFGPIGLMPIVLAALLASAALGVKLYHARINLRPVAQLDFDVTDERVLLTLPSTYYGESDFAVVDPGREIPPGTVAAHAYVPVLGGKRFGETGTVRGTVPQDTWLVSNILAFPWNRIVLDGKHVPAEQTKIEPRFIMVNVPAGDLDVGYRFAPPRTWTVLRGVSFWTFGVWTLATIGALAASAVMHFFSVRRPATSTPVSNRRTRRG